MDGFSRTPKEERLQALAQLIPEAFTEGKVDWEKLKAALGEDINFANERYVLNWAGKSDAFRIMQQPSSATLIPVREASVDFDRTNNIFIEGENMETLKILQKSYFGKVKMIYIDPPYNTGNDSFIYPDRFAESREEYLQRIGDIDEDGTMTREGMFHKNSKENGQYHSNWLNMMMPRLYLAKSLLRDDGVIFVSIDDNEVHNLRLLMNEVFGEENFIGNFIWKRRQRADSRNQNKVSGDHEYIMCFGKTLSASFLGEKIDLSKYKNPDNDPRGAWASIDLSGLANAAQRPNLHFTITDPATNISYLPNPNRGWSKSKDVIASMISDKRILFPKNENGRPREKKFLKDLLSELTGFSTCLDNNKVGFTTHGTRESMNIFKTKLFDFPKPKNLIYILTEQITKNNDIILDFFAGSGTTAHAVMQLNREDGGNRQYICVQMAEPCKPESEAYKAGYRTIADIAMERIRRAGQQIRQEIETEREEQREQLDLDDGMEPKIPDLGFKVFRLSESNFKQWRAVDGANRQEWEQQMMDFINPVAPNATAVNMVYELLLKNGKDLNSTIENKNGYTLVNGTEIALVLEEITPEIIDGLLAAKPDKVIVLDKLFEGNDQLKTNTALQMKDAGIQFRTI